MTSPLAVLFLDRVGFVFFVFPFGATFDLAFLRTDGLFFLSGDDGRPCPHGARRFFILDLATNRLEQLSGLISFKHGPSF